MDHASHSCIDKLSHYNLMNPLPVALPSIKLSLIEKQKQAKKNRLNFVNELKEMCTQRLIEIRDSFKDIDIIAAIKSCIKTLALQDTLLAEENKLQVRCVIVKNYG